jgi:peptidoglycan/LPS O-acetylase OafA/YrhL
MYARRKTLWAIFAVLVAGLAYFATTPNFFSIPMASIGYDWLALFYLTAMILALTDSNSWLARMLRWRWLRSLGAIAYGAYLFHYVIYGLCMALLRGQAGYLQNLSDVAVTLFALALTILFTTLSWRYFEKPIVRWGHRLQYETPNLS